MQAAIRRPIQLVLRRVRRLIGATCLAYAANAGIGDHMMLSTVARELKRRGHRRVFIVSEYPDLFLRNPDVDRVTRRGSSLSWLFVRLASRHEMWLTYLINYDLATGEHDPPPDPAAAYLCRRAGITGRVDVRPYIFLSEAERAWGAPYHGAIAIQSSSRAAQAQSLNKEWFPERFAEVAAHLMKSHPVVQIGSPSDPPLPCTHDLRGKTSLRQLAALLAHCRMYVGLEGMPMHMARAVDCPSVIVYGGRLRPDQIGYASNENLYNSVACAPCWLDSRCDFGRVCLSSITARDVIEAAERILARPREDLAVDSYEIKGSIEPLGEKRANPVTDRSPAARAVPPRDSQSAGPQDPAAVTTLAERLLSINLAGAIRLARFGPKDAGQRLEAAYRQINPFGTEHDANKAASDECAQALARIPEVELAAIIRGQPVVKMDAGHQGGNGAMSPFDTLAFLAVLVDRAPRTVLEVGPSDGHKAQLFALNLPSAAIHRISMPEDDDAGSTRSLKPNGDLPPIAPRTIGVEYQSDPSNSNVVQYFGDTTTWDFRKVEGATFYIIDGMNTYDRISINTGKAVVAARGRDATFLWHGCDTRHPGVVRWLANMVWAGYPVRRIAGTHLAIMDISAAAGAPRDGGA